MDDKIRKSLRYSTLDGVFASIMQGFSENFITPYALAMMATTAQIGILASLPSLIGSLAQLETASVVDRLGSRMRLIAPCVLAHTLMWVPMILAPYIAGPRGVTFLLVSFILYIALNAFDMPAWSSLMSDHVSEDQRGAFFGWRTRLLGFISVGASFAAGFILNLFRQAAILGFTVIFSIAFLARLISWHFLRRMSDLPLVIREEHKFTFRQFMKRLTTANFGRFVIFAAAMNFSVFLFSPFLVVYMLKDLKFGYLTYTLVTLAATVVSLASIKTWGVHADHVGNRRVLRLTSLFIPLVPILWLFSHNFLYLLAIQIFAGFFWSGFNLSSANFIFDAVTPEKRTRCIAYFNVINGIAIFFGAILGGLLLRWLPPLFGYRILTLGLLSGLFRSLSALLCARVREVRAVKAVSSADLFYSVIGIRPIGQVIQRE